MPQTAPTEHILELFEGHYEALYCHLRRFTTPRETEQICRQAFNELVRGDRIQSARPDRDTLFRLADLLIRERYRPLRRIAQAVEQMNVYGTCQHRKDDDALTPRTPVATRVLRKMEREMQQLPGDLRQAMLLLIGQKIPAEEASARMGVSTELLDRWATHGLRRLTQRMNSHVSHQQR